MPVVRTGRVVADRGEDPTQRGDGHEDQEPRTDTAGDVAHLPIVLIGRSMGWTGSPGWQLRLAKTLPTGLYLQGCHSHSRQPFAAGVGRWASAGDHRRDDPGRHDGRHAGGRAGRDLRRHRGRPGGRPGLGEEPDWQERALCAQTDPEAFFPEKGGSTREAKRICSGLRGAGRVPRLRAGARRALRHLGRALRAGAPPPASSRGLTTGYAGPPSTASGSMFKYSATCSTSTSCSRSARSAPPRARFSSGRR